MNAAPETQSPRGTFVMNVLSNRQLCRGHYLMRLGGCEFPPTLAGQFVQLQCRIPGAQAGWSAVEVAPDDWPKPTGRELTEAEPLLRRPLSLAGRRDTEFDVELDIIYSVVGKGTAWLARAGEGDEISLLGPLGNAFAISDRKPLAALVGGGVGIPPMIYLASAMQTAGKGAVAFCGARSADMLPVTLAPAVGVAPDGQPSASISQFAQFGVDSVIATDDGSLGWKGFVSESLARWLDGLDTPSDDAVVYTCGPEPMMRVVAEICIARDVECQVSLERHMACGMGTCQSCVCKTKSDAEQGWSYKLCCTDGPVFDARAIIWG
ncbi:MAG: dihydroorotate dehydrogenase electron transfer subunit [Phycisphaerae bacterium]|jgi:dihydroorotate dehydrogenase electron transfer subunit|nr:dihydroorotate dehydrogenase electron transfer subunit [Phycisphaerae bacterium]